MTIVDGGSMPRLATHMRLKLDNARNIWTIQAPEKVFLLDETAHAVLSRCTGGKRLDAVVDELCTVYNADERAVIQSDVIGLIQEFVDKGILTI